MIVGGLQKNSFIDYPGKISCVVFLSGCNFRCPYCQNPDLVEEMASSPYTREGILAFLDTRRDFIDGVVISGGEPTIQPDLVSFCRDIRATGYDIKLDTNGSRPGVLKKLVAASLIDYIAMDVKTDPYEYAPAIRGKGNPQDLLTSIELIKDSGLPYEFRTTCVKPFVSEKIVARIARLIDGAMLYALQQFNTETVLYPEFFQDIDGNCNRREMMAFKTIADPYVQRCIVR